MIQESNQLKRIEFCNRLIDTNHALEDVIFTDEPSVKLNQNLNVSYRKKSAAKNMKPKPKHPLKEHVYGALSRQGHMNIVIFEGIMDAEFFTASLKRQGL